MKKKILMLLTAIGAVTFLSLIAAGCVKSKAVETTKEASVSIAVPAVSSTHPALTGKLVFHRYDNYGDASKLYMYDFSANTLTWISKNWGIFDPINGQFNFNGTQIVFMGEATQNGKWDIYLWTVGSSNPPTNLTSTDGCRDEDPEIFSQWFPDLFQADSFQRNGQPEDHGPER